jgi:leader peptidase (prepilin peptidase) / N-methyltransferase
VELNDTSVGWVFAVAVFALGAAIGSFLNVVIYRLPHGQSIVRPGSRCPACETPIRAWHNVPIFGWLWLRGRCASCSVRISPRYPLIELLMAALSVALFHGLSGGLLTVDAVASSGFTAEVVVPYVLYLVFVAGLVAVTFIDLDWFIIPDVISLPGIPLGICVTAVAGDALGVTLEDGLIGAAVGAGVIMALIVGYGWLRGRQGMGGGDWKLLAMIGAWLGWQALPLVLLLSSLQGILLVLLFGRAFAVDELPPEPGQGDDASPEPVAEGVGQLAIPFGPFLSLAALEILYLRPELDALLATWLDFGP